MVHYANVNEFMEVIQNRDPHQPEFTQSVREFFTSIWGFLEANPYYKDYELLSRITEPERMIQFRVTWLDDNGKVQVNRAWRVQFNSAIGPYKGGMRFHPTVNISILKFLGFEQTFKNALTTLPMGGGKGGSDFNPTGKSRGEIMRFCQSVMVEPHRYLGSSTDIPAGDVGVGEREVGYMVGMMKKLTNDFSCVFTGKNTSFGGSLIRPESTGYGLIYFVKAMLERRNQTLEGMRVSVSGAGNVAQYTIKKAVEMGAKVVTASDSGGMIYDEAGFDEHKAERFIEMMTKEGKRLQDYAEEFGLTYHEGEKPWSVPVDIALPCAIQNELRMADAFVLIRNGVKVVAEGANMPTTIDATNAFLEAGVLFAPGKAANAGGVATSGLEMAQNAIRLSWTAEKVDRRLHDIMLNIHEACVVHGEHREREQGVINYVEGANIAGFIKVADAMIAQGVI